MTELVFLLEEPSAKAMLQGLLPRIVPGLFIRYIVFKGKQDLDKQIVFRLRHYRTPNARFIVLRDQDSADCRDVKAQLNDKCREAGKENALVRIACHQLESWYLADLVAVERGLELRSVADKQSKRKYREPDRLANAADELARLTDNRYQKLGGSRAIGPHLDVNNTRSRSFAVFIAGLNKLAVTS